MKRVLAILLLAILVGLFAFAFYLGTKSPSNEREWDVAFSKLNTTDTREDGSITIHNLRDFTYDIGTTTARDWRDVTINPDDFESVWFFLDHFKPDTPEVGHTFISFRMKDGSTIAFSIEARREAGEKYTFLGGFIRTFDLQYLWGTERDLIGQRVVLKDEQLYMFPLVLSHEQAVGLFKEFARETNALAAKPRFYNTLTANCTNLLAKIVNHYHPGTLPYDISWNLTGLADGYLEKQGFIATGSRDRDTMRTDHALTRHKSEIATHQKDSAADFSSFVRTILTD